jgi:hypothetical protein
MIAPMNRAKRWLACLLLPAFAAGAAAATFAAVEESFLDYLDAASAVAFLESGMTATFEGRDLSGWQGLAALRRIDLDRGLVEARGVDEGAVAAMRNTLATLAAEAATPVACSDAARRDLAATDMRAALAECFREHGNRLQFEGAAIDRGTALQLLHVIEEPARRKAVFEAFAPLWAAVNGRNEPDSPYRRMIALAAADARRGGSEVAAAASAIGATPAEVERWLVEVLEAWHDASPPQPVEPWDYRYLNSEANRLLDTKIPAESLLATTTRFYRDSGADLGGLRVLFDLAPRPDKSPVAYTDFLSRGRILDGTWHRPRARVVGTYETGGLFALNELVHEAGHAVHVSAIHTRPAYMDWPDTLITEAFADVPAWSVHEPAWQRRYLGADAPETASLRAMFGNVMLDVAWSLFEMRMLRDPASDPNLVWSDITSRYLHIVPHPEVPWWAMRVQLASDPGYMVNYGLGALLTAEIRAATVAAIGPIDAGNEAWYRWTSAHLLRFGSERSTRELLQGLLGRPVRPDALLAQVRRCWPAR